VASPAQGGSSRREMVFVADTTQDVYETARARTDEVMRSVAFTGPGHSFPTATAYRLPSARPPGSSPSSISQTTHTFGKSQRSRGG
jgi:hypothetical protein